MIARLARKTGLPPAAVTAELRAAAWSLPLAALLFALLWIVTP